jgi:hypothetical protein
MSDYTGRADELLTEIEGLLQPVLPEQAIRNIRDAIGVYMPRRRECLEDLLEILADESESTRETARAWTDRCNAMRAAVPGIFENVLRNIVLPTEAAAVGYRWHMTVVANEDRFFSTLAAVNAAQVRDYLVANRQSLKNYTDMLDQKWRTIVGEGNKLQSEEKKLYDEMVDMTKKIVSDFAAAERTVYEKSRQGGNYVLIGAEKGADLIEWVLNLPDGTADAIGKAAEALREENERWLEGNQYIQGRMANYRALVQAEKGGVLPLFKETRRQVYEYWDRNNVERARDWIARAKRSLEDWLTACPTHAQQDDAKRFYDEAFKAVEKHLENVEAVASEFETRWNGVFKGALATTTIDELLDTASWRMNAETLVAIRTPALVDELVKKMDGYYEESFAAPLDKLKQQVDGLSDEQKAEAVRAVELVRKSAEESVKARVKSLQQQVAASLNWFQPDAIQKSFDRTDLQGSLE